VRKIQEYLRYAAECREMARTCSSGRRQQLEQMAATWEQLAKSREQHLQKLKEAGRLKTGLVIPQGEEPPPKRDPGA
jgi:hypothetical protein